MLERKSTLHKPEKIYPTGGNPLLVTCEDTVDYVCKHGRLSSSLLFNEVVASRFAEIWNLRTPQICLVDILPAHIPDSSNFMQPAFFNKPCFGSKYLEDSKEVDNTLLASIKNGSFRRKIKNREDFLKIALFDIWLSNEDRKHNNSNLLLDFSGGDEYYFYVFDHDAIFNSNAINYGLVQITENESIINTDLATILFKRGVTLTRLVDKIVESFYLCTTECEVQLKQIMNLIPDEWNLNINELEVILRNNLFNNEWKAECEKTFRTFIQKFIN